MFFACKKEASVSMSVSTFVVPTTAWVINRIPDYYKYVITTPVLTQQVVDDGTIQVFSKSRYYPEWFGWPDVTAGYGNQGFRFSYKTDTLTLYADDFYNNPPDTCTIKLVVIK